MKQDIPKQFSSYCSNCDATIVHDYVENNSLDEIIGKCRKCESVNKKRRKPKIFTLYKIYYKNPKNEDNEDHCVYLGRTKQKLNDRLRGHFYAKPMHKKIDIHLVSKIESVECESEADMFLYEIYYINKLKPCLNFDDKACDDLSVSLIDLNFTPHNCHLLDKWKNNL